MRVCTDHAAQAGFAAVERRFWPFPVLKPEPEWSDFERDYVELMRRAHAAGFRPCEGPCTSVEAEAPSCRAIALVRRGSRNGWEPFMMDGSRSVRLGSLYDLPLGECACVCIRPPFRAAARFALEWLHGRELTSLLSEYDLVGGRPSGIVLRATALSTASTGGWGAA